MIVPGPQLLAHLHPSDDDGGDGDQDDGGCHASDDDSDTFSGRAGDVAEEEGGESSPPSPPLPSTSRPPRRPLPSSTSEGPKGDKVGIFVGEGEDDGRRGRPESDAVVVVSLPAAAALTLLGFAMGVLPMAAFSRHNLRFVGDVGGASNYGAELVPSRDGWCAAATPDGWCWNWSCFMIGSVAAAALMSCVFLVLTLSSPPLIMAGGAREGYWHRSVPMRDRIVARLGEWGCATIIDWRSTVLGCDERRKSECFCIDGCGTGCVNRDGVNAKDDTTRQRLEGRDQGSEADADAVAEEERQRRLRYRHRIAAALGSVHAPPPGYHNRWKDAGHTSAGHAAAHSDVGGTRTDAVENAPPQGGRRRHPRHRRRVGGEAASHYADLAEAHAGLLLGVDSCLGALRVATGLRLGLGPASGCVARAERALLGRNGRGRSGLHVLGLDRARRSVFHVLRGVAASLANVRDAQRGRGESGSSAHHSQGDDNSRYEDQRDGDENYDNGSVAVTLEEVSTHPRRSPGRKRHDHGWIEASSPDDYPASLLTLSFLATCRRDVARSLSRCIDGGMINDGGICGTNPGGLAVESRGDGDSDDDELNAVMESVQLAREAEEYLRAAFASIFERCNPIEGASVPSLDVARLRKLREVFEAASIALWSFEETVTQQHSDGSPTECGDTKKETDETVIGRAADWWSQCGDLIAECLDRYKALDVDLPLVSQTHTGAEMNSSSCDDSHCFPSEECADDNPEPIRTEYEDRGKLCLGQAEHVTSLEHNVSNVTVIYSATVEEKKYPANKRDINRNKKVGANCKGSHDELPHFDPGVATGNLVKELRRRLEAMSIPKEISALTTHPVKTDDDAPKATTSTEEGFAAPIRKNKKTCESFWLGADKSLLSELMEAQKSHTNLVQDCVDVTAEKTFIGEA